MSNRSVSVAACLFLASVAAFGVCTPATTARFVLEFPQLNSSGSRFQGFDADNNCQLAVIDATGPTNVSQMVAKPDGTKFYVRGSSGIQSVDPAFASTSFHSVNGITGTPTAMAMSPDGKYLYVGAGGLYILDTATDSVLSNGVSITGTIAGFAFSADSNFAYILTNQVLGSSITKVNTSTRQRVGSPLNLQFGCDTSTTGTVLCSIGMSPQQLLYVTQGYYIYEVDPVALASTTTGTISTNTSTLGPLRFTPDGTTAYAVNLTPSIGARSLLQLNLSTHAVSELNFFNAGINAPAFIDVFPASATRVFAISGPDTTLWDVTPSPFAATPSTSLASIPNGVNNVLGATLSNEQPAARYLFLLSANGNQTNLLKVDLSTNAVVNNTLAILGPGRLDFASVPPQTGAAGFNQFNTTQTVNPGGTSAPLAAVVTNSAGIPLYNIPVTYSVPTGSGIVINNPSTATNGLGYATATATMPSTAGTYAITLTAGSATATYNITVPGAGGGGGTPGGSNQVSIVVGDGQLIYSTQDSVVPLTVKVLNTDGTPLVNTSVAFVVTSGPGDLVPTNYPSLDASGNPLTDSNGMASVLFKQPFGLNGGTPFATSIVTASTVVGAVQFHETTYQLNAANSSAGQGTGAPSIVLQQPTDLSPVAVGEGDIVPNAIVARVQTGNVPPFGPIQYVGMRISDPANPLGNSPAASCQGGTPLSDSNGVITCNLVVSCKIGTNFVGIQPVVGELVNLPPTGLTLHVGPGSSRAIAKASGDNQSGQGGQTLGQALVAKVTDNCGTPVGGVAATWKVTQGSATLTNTVSTSDSSGNLSTKVVLGSVPGAAQVTVSIGTSAQVVFNATVNVTIAGIALTSGNTQSALVGQGFTQPLVFTVSDTTGKPVQGVQVNFSVASGSASVSPSSSTTNSAGQVTVNATAGGTPGPVVIQAKTTTFTANANLTVNAPGPVITAASFVNAASLKPGLVGCGLATVTGSGIAPTLTPGQVVLGNQLGFGPLPYTIASASLTVNGIPAPLYAVSNSSSGIQQLTFQTPCETQPGPATVSMTAGTGASAATTTVTGVQVFAAQPGIFTYAGPNGKLYGAVIRGVDGSYVTPSNLARRGETYYLVATGLGQTTPTASTNAAGAGQTISNTLIVGVNNAGVPVTSAQYVAVGVYYIGFQIPLDAPQGVDQNLAIGEVVGLQTVYDNQGALLPGVQ
ncbi:MAG: hypothetical protein JO062_24445 [Bryobacterales bacterium]|nr:hypothetical protein [Bryobacterales bacterium]